MHEQEAQESTPQPVTQLQNLQRTLQMSLTEMTFSDQSHAAEKRENLQSLAQDSATSTILRIQTRLAIKACDDSKKLGSSPCRKKSAQSPLLPLIPPPDLLLPGMLSPQMQIISNALEEGKS